MTTLKSNFAWMEIFSEDDWFLVLARVASGEFRYLDHACRDLVAGHLAEMLGLEADSRHDTNWLRQWESNDDNLSS